MMDKKPAAHSTAQAGFFDDIQVTNSSRPITYRPTDNPRELRAMELLVRRPSVPREIFDSEVGCSNGPALIQRMREAGLGKDHLQCTKVAITDRDGLKVWVGTYHLSPKGRAAVIRAIKSLAMRRDGGAK